MELFNITRHIVEEFGKEIIADKRFLYIIADCYSFRDTPAEKHIISALISNGYTASILKSSYEGDVSLTINKIVFSLVRDYGFKENLVADVVSSIVKGIGCEYKQEQKYSDDKLDTLKPIVQDVEMYNDSVQFYLKRTTQWKGKEVITCDAIGHYNQHDGSFVIHKGSKLYALTGKQRGYIYNDKGVLRLRIMNLNKNIGISSTSYQDRKSILECYCKLELPHYYLVENDIICATPSEAAFISTGSDTNGLTAWKSSKGNSLKEYPKSSYENSHQIFPSHLDPKRQQVSHIPEDFKTKARMLPDLKMVKMVWPWDSACIKWMQNNGMISELKTITIKADPLQKKYDEMWSGYEILIRDKDEIERIINA